ncbi:hypothetical protein DFS34DRAFT_205664 [Phlyctochytrium arcticum]|nr:hypothetical protein DFS34DRAFT_205664 [Phlyctochytrium arcticum]
MAAAITINPAEEAHFASTFLQQLTSRPIRYQPSYEPAPQEWNVVLPPASRPFVLRENAAQTSNAASATSQTITLTIKSIKPPAAPFTLDLSPIDTIHTLKSQIAERTGVPVGEQRLVWGGKVLAEGKMVGDYEGAQGAVSLVRRAGAAGDATSSPKPPAPATSAPASGGKTQNALEEKFKETGRNPEFWTAIRSTLQDHFPESTVSDTVSNF